MVTKIAAIALTHTGLSRESARFQARSAFTGVGFTTNESEKVVNHPLRRRILLMLMLLGNAGIVTAMSTLILTFVNLENTSPIAIRLFLLCLGIVLLWGVASSRAVDNHLSGLVRWGLRRYTRLDVQDYAGLLHLAGDYQVTEMQVKPTDWMADRTLNELKLREEGLMVLGITRTDGTFIGAPRGSTKVLPYDTLILYGRVSAQEEIDRRRKGGRGEHEHRKAVAEQEEIIRQEKRRDPAER
ncbi:MAG: TrkA C-terminal domain-containing protein [Desulfobacterales bacterium]